MSTGGYMRPMKLLPNFHTLMPNAMSLLRAQLENQQLQAYTP